MTTGKTVQALNTLKNLLHQRLAESEWLSKEVTRGKMAVVTDTEELLAGVTTCLQKSQTWEYMVQ